MEQNENNTRTRMNASLTAKGFVQWDITAEYDSPELTAEMLGRAIDLERKVIKDKGLIEIQPTDK
jgi:hypothetical protein